MPIIQKPHSRTMLQNGKTLDSPHKYQPALIRLRGLYTMSRSESRWQFLADRLFTPYVMPVIFDIIGRPMGRIDGEFKLLIVLKLLVIPFNLELDHHKLTLCGSSWQAHSPSALHKMNYLTDACIEITCACTCTWCIDENKSDNRPVSKEGLNCGYGASTAIIVLLRLELKFSYLVNRRWLFWDQYLSSLLTSIPRNDCSDAVRRCIQYHEMATSFSLEWLWCWYCCSYRAGREWKSGEQNSLLRERVILMFMAATWLIKRFGSKMTPQKRQ